MKRNYNYAKITENGIEYAPNILLVGDKQMINAPAEEYAKQGFLPIERTPQPQPDPQAETAVYYTAQYEALGGKIVQTWAASEQ